ncbi:hypothetical protein LY90DRAFT_671538 [Neocallimastix californiae]|uniref:DNA mismatch repair protein S5 domain-containing protein n=1 Tax=Neocallimastix californiae TaxID=1754190 RepID=A0A1Y2CGH9_9FUNG|nr:hypothetical protein LY90DRAFT_671538 [Neocallimastix californiae]|eukprot:ORY45425.1 hypothetical protein LY90DRAFT_671538 [Neocallimastix californiae]
MFLKKLDFNTRNLLRSTYVITSIFQCIIELVENSLDAKATKIEIEIDFSKNDIHITDNGIGISLENLKVIGNRYVTSKCHTIEDLKQIKTYGFRGEALASIFQIADIEINTKIESSEEVYSLYVNYGKIKYCGISDNYIKYKSGTSIYVQNIFSKIPVRQKQLNKRRYIYEGIKKNIEILALIEPGVEFSVINKQNGRVILHTKSNNVSSLDTFKDLYDTLLSEDLISINLNSKDIPDYKFDKYSYSVSGFIGFSGSPKKYNEHFQRNYNDLFRPYIPTFILNTDKKLRKYPIFFLNISCSTDIYDICMDPSKRIVEFEDWESILNFIKLSIYNALEQYKINIQDYKESNDIERLSITQSKFFSSQSLNKKFSQNKDSIEKDRNSPLTYSTPFDKEISEDYIDISIRNDDNDIDDENNSIFSFSSSSNIDLFEEETINQKLNENKTTFGIRDKEEKINEEKKKDEKEKEKGKEEEEEEEEEEKLNIITDKEIENNNNYTINSNGDDTMRIFNFSENNFLNYTEFDDIDDLNKNDYSEFITQEKNDSSLELDIFPINKSIINEINENDYNIIEDDNNSNNINNENENIDLNKEIENINDNIISKLDENYNNESIAIKEKNDKVENNNIENSLKSDQNIILDNEFNTYSDMQQEKKLSNKRNGNKNQELNNEDSELELFDKYSYQSNSKSPIIQRAENIRRRKRKHLNEKTDHNYRINNSNKLSKSVNSFIEIAIDSKTKAKESTYNKKLTKIKINPLLERFKKFKKNNEMNIDLCSSLNNKNKNTDKNNDSNNVNLRGEIEYKDLRSKHEKKTTTSDINDSVEVSLKNQNELYESQSYRFNYETIYNKLINNKIIFNKQHLKNLQVIGQADQKFIVCKLTGYENKDKKKGNKKFSDILVLLDQHAIDERIQLEILIDQYKHGNSQGNGPEITNLTPAIRIILPNHEIKRIEEFTSEFKNIGIYFVEEDFKQSHINNDREITDQENEIINNYKSDYIDRDNHLKIGLFNLYNKNSILNNKNNENIGENKNEEEERKEEVNSSFTMNSSNISKSDELLSALSIIRIKKLPKLIVERCLTSVEKLTNIVRNCLYELEDSHSKYKSISSTISSPDKSSSFLENEKSKSNRSTNTSIFFSKNYQKEASLSIQSFNLSDRKLDFIPSSIYDILCSLACHKAIKFDDPLNLKECREIVEQMPSLKFPFQCAHGRPTIIPLINLTYLKQLSSLHIGFDKEYNSLLKKFSK